MAYFDQLTDFARGIETKEGSPKRKDQALKILKDVKSLTEKGSINGTGKFPRLSSTVGRQRVSIRKELGGISSKFPRSWTEGSENWKIFFSGPLKPPWPDAQPRFYRED